MKNIGRPLPAFDASRHPISNVSAAEQCLTQALKSTLKNRRRQHQAIQNRHSLMLVTDFSETDKLGLDNCYTVAVLVIPVSEYQKWNTEFRKEFRSNFSFKKDDEICYKKIPTSNSSKTFDKHISTQLRENIPAPPPSRGKGSRLKLPFLASF